MSGCKCSDEIATLAKRLETVEAVAIAKAVEAIPSGLSRDRNIEAFVGGWIREEIRYVAKELRRLSDPTPARRRTPRKKR